MNRTGVSRPANWTVMSIAVLALWSVAMLVTEAPYLHDFGEWLFQSQVLKNLIILPELVPAYSVNPYPVPNSLVVVLLAALGSALPAIWAGKIFLIGLATAWFFVSRRFAAQHFEDGQLAAGAFFLLATMAFSTFFWYGFVSYQAALLLFAAFLSIDDHRITPLTIGVFSVLLFFAHGMLFLVFCLYVLIRTALKHEFKPLFALLPSAALSLWFLQGRSLTGYVAPVAHSQWSGLTEAVIYKAGYPGMLGPFKNLLREDGSSLLERQAWLYWSGFVTNFAVAGLIGLFALWVFWNRKNVLTGPWGPSSGNDRALLLTTALLGLLYVIAPYNFFGLFNPGGRLLLPALLMILVAGRAQVGQLLRAVQWPVVFFTLLSCCSYLYLVFPEQKGLKLETAAPRFSGLPGDSVFEFNRAAYAHTRYAYFNYRIFAFARRFEQIENKTYSGLGLRVGIIDWHKPSASCGAEAGQCKE